MRINIIYITLSYKYTPCIGVAYTNYPTSSLNISIGRKLYYNNSLFLNRSIDLTSISL